MTRDIMSVINASTSTLATTRQVSWQEERSRFIATILVCESCGLRFKPVEDLFAKLMLDQATGDETPASDESGETEESPAEDEEEPDMSDDALTAYYNRYIALVQDQKQQTSIFTEGQLKEFITELFRSVEYEPGEPDGNRCFRSTSYFVSLSFRSTGVHFVSNLLWRGSTYGAHESKSILFRQKADGRKRRVWCLSAEKLFHLFDWVDLWSSSDLPRWFPSVSFRAYPWTRSSPVDFVSSCNLFSAVSRG